jgi:hypothetical protein
MDRPLKEGDVFSIDGWVTLILWSEGPDVVYMISQFGIKYWCSMQKYKTVLVGDFVFEESNVL